MSAVLIALGIGFAVGFIVLMVYFAGCGHGYAKGWNDHGAAVEYVLMNDPVARRDLVEGLAEKDESDRLREQIDAHRQAARERRN